MTAPTFAHVHTRNQRRIADLFCSAAPAERVLFWIDHPGPPRPNADRGADPLTAAPGEVQAWIDWHVADYEARAAWQERLNDDAVPLVKICTGTQLFAAAFGCEMVEFEESNPAARPLVTTAAQADRLPEPSLTHPVFARLHQVVERIRARVGPDVPISVPDIQSPFDIAALIWDKEAMFLALYEEPEAVLRLVGKCQDLLQRFVEDYRLRYGNVSTAHCPNLWLPAEAGLGLSEDECGAISCEQFATFCLPALVALSRRFGGMHLHCCAAADHQYPQFRRIPQLRGLNRVFQAVGPQPAIDAFHGQAVLAQAWVDERYVQAMLAGAHGDSRFMFNMKNCPLDEAKALLQRLRQRAADLPVTAR